MSTPDMKVILVTMTLALPRPLALFSLMPFLGQGLVQGMVRNSIMVSMALVSFPLVYTNLPSNLVLVELIYLIFKEILIGVLLGFTASLVFRIPEGVGYFIDNQRGATMATVFDPSSGEQTSALGSMMLQLFTAMFFSVGGFLVLITAMLESYKLWPVFAELPPLNDAFALYFLQLADKLMRLIVIFSAPVIAAVFAAEFALGLINRFAPQMNVFFLAMPIKSAVAALMMLLYVRQLLEFTNPIEALQFFPMPSGGNP